MQTDQTLLFPPFRLDPANARLWHGTQVVHLKPKSFAVLAYLLQHPERLVTREELLQAIWPEATVLGDEAVNSCIKDIRRTLGDQVKTPRFIETVPTRGYRFIGTLVHPALPEAHAPAGHEGGIDRAAPGPGALRPDEPLELPEAEHSFIVGPPIPQPRRFFGRERELTRLFTLWKRLPLQNAAIIGPGRSGKTSLLLHLRRLSTTPAGHLRDGQRADWLQRPERYQWLFADFHDPRLGTRAGFLRHLLLHLGLAIPDPCDLEHFLDAVTDHLHAPTVILLDNIDVALQRYTALDNTFWEALRALATTQVEGRLAFVLAACQPPHDVARQCGLSSPFFNIFGYTAQLGPLTEPEARALIASAPQPFARAEVDWILAQSQHWPLLVQILCRERLYALDEGDTSSTWQTEGLRQITPFRHLLEPA